MGRKLKYKTEDEQLEAKRRWRREWYHRNKKWVNPKRMRKYYAEVDKEVSAMQ